MKRQAEVLNDELKMLTTSLRHKSLAYVINQARERRKAEEARAEATQLAQSLKQGAA